MKPELLEDFLHFFDKDAFADYPDWSGCYCAFYETAGDSWDVGPDSVDSAVVHRREKADRIRTGKSTGLLAYADGKVVGWCNAQPRSSFSNMRRYSVVVDDPSESVGSIMCFLVAHDYRGKGVGASLLNTACDVFRSEGLRVAEGYPTTAARKPNSETPWAEANYKGPLSLYLKNGFAIHKQLERFAIVRRKL